MNHSNQSSSTVVQRHNLAQRPQHSWSMLDPTMAAIDLEKLELLCHPEQILVKIGYVTKPLSDRAILSKTRCERCGFRMKNHRPATVVKDTDLINVNDQDDAHTTSNPPDAGQKDEQASMIKKDVGANRLACKFHDGRVVRGFWSCCQGRPNSPGCTLAEHHTPDAVDALKAYWAYHTTPAPPGPQQARGDARRGRRGRNISRPSGSSTRDLRRAVALDCEMGVATTGNTELIRLTMVDFFTSEILIDSLVQPTVPMSHYNTRYSGVRGQDIYQAIKNGQCILGREQALNQIWRHVSPATIVVMHSGQNDLNSLRWIHDKVVDTFLLEAYDPYAPRGKSLKDLSARKLNIQIQKNQKVDGYPVGHDSLEDAMATRELAIWWLNLIPNVL